MPLKLSLERFARESAGPPSGGLELTDPAPDVGLDASALSWTEEVDAAFAVFVVSSCGGYDIVGGAHAFRLGGPAVGCGPGEAAGGFGEDSGHGKGCQEDEEEGVGAHE